MSPQTRGRPTVPAAPAADYLTGYAAAQDDPTVDLTLRSDLDRSGAWWAGYADGLEEAQMMIAPPRPRRAVRYRPGSLADRAVRHAWIIPVVVVLAWLAGGWH